MCSSSTVRSKLNKFEHVQGPVQWGSSWMFEHICIVRFHVQGCGGGDYGQGQGQGGSMSEGSLCGNVECIMDNGHMRCLPPWRECLTDTTEKAHLNRYNCPSANRHFLSSCLNKGLRPANLSCYNSCLSVTESYMHQWDSTETIYSLMDLKADSLNCVFFFVIQLGSFYYFEFKTRLIRLDLSFQ